MSLSGSAAEDFNKTGDAKLRSNDAQPPTPTAENPAGVAPQASGGPAPAGSMPGSGAPDHGGDVRGAFGNIELFKETFAKLSNAFSDALNTISDESGSGLGTQSQALRKRLQEMQSEVEGWVKGEGLAEVKQAGGERGDNVEEGGGGLYKD